MILDIAAVWTRCKSNWLALIVSPGDHWPECTWIRTLRFIDLKSL